MKILAISASPRKGGNSDVLCDEFMKGAAESGHEVQKIRLVEKKIAPCLACYGCTETHICVRNDDMTEVLEAMKAADVIALAAPVYFLFRLRSNEDHDRPLFCRLSVNQRQDLLSDRRGSRTKSQCGGNNAFRYARVSSLSARCKGSGHDSRNGNMG